MKNWIIKKGSFYHAKNDFGGDILIADKRKAFVFNSQKEANKTCRLLNQLSDSYEYDVIENNSYLEAKASVATDLYNEGKITRSECLRHEVDLLFGEDTGVIKIN